MKAIWIRLFEEKLSWCKKIMAHLKPRPNIRVKACLGGGEFGP
jgi:hypothetical protein